MRLLSFLCGAAVCIAGCQAVPTASPPPVTPVPLGTQAPFATAGPGDQSIEVVIAAIVRELSPEASKNILVLVHPRLYAGLSLELATLAADMKNESWQPVVSTMSVASAEELRQALRLVYRQRQFAGVLLVGDYPYPRMWSYPIESPDQPGPADYYFMDLDGEWLDSNKDGFLDVQMSGSGDRDPEVFVGRLDASSVTILEKSELEMMRDYFHRNHAYRSGGMTTKHAAIYATHAHHYYGRYDRASAGWAGHEIQSLKPLLDSTYAFIFDDETAETDDSEWPGEFWKVPDVSSRTKVSARSHFIGLMGDGYDYLSIGIHSWDQSWGSSFFGSTDVRVVAEVGQLPLFVLSAACSTGNIDKDNNMGSTLTMAGSLVFFGFSVPADLTWEEVVLWNKSLKDQPIGIAFKKVQEAATPAGTGPVLRNVNWILLGDPTLRLRR